MTDPQPDEALTIAQGGGPPVGMPWTLVVAGDPGWSADLEHAAPLPRAGERIELIEVDGSRRQLRVSEVIHVVQPSAAERPAVRSESSSPNATVNEPDAEAAPAAPRSLRAGLPRVIAAPIEDEPAP